MIKSTFSKNKRVKRKAFLALLFLYPSVLPGGVIVHLVFISTLKHILNLISYVKTSKYLLNNGQIKFLNFLIASLSSGFYITNYDTIHIGRFFILLFIVFLDNYNETIIYWNISFSSFTLPELHLHDT